jgi:transketolase
MRREFFVKLYNEMHKNSNIIAVTADLGYGGFNKIQENLPKQFVNVGAAEQTALDLAVGLAQAGKIPFVYTITPFYYRGFETIRTYINHESIPVKLIGSGRDSDYEHDGFSHYAGDDRQLFFPFDNITCFWPTSIEEMEKRVDEMIEEPKAYYLNLRR